MARKKNVTVLTIDPPAHRNPVAVALQRRHGSGRKVMKDRRTPRGGAKRPDHNEGW